MLPEVPYSGASHADVICTFVLVSLSKYLQWSYVMKWWQGDIEVRNTGARGVQWCLTGVPEEESGALQWYQLGLCYCVFGWRLALLWLLGLEVVPV